MEGKEILVFADWYLPGFRAGGPIRSLANLVAHTHHRYSIVTRNTDLHSSAPYEGIPTGEWITTAPNVRVCYLDERALTLQKVISLMREQNYHRFYLNSLFSPRFTLFPLLAAWRAGRRSDVVLAPRGMLKSGALSVKAGKKKWFLRMAAWMHLYEGITWHATGEDEASEIRNVFSGARIHLAPNISGHAEPVVPPLKQPGLLKLISIARISPEKGIREALSFLASAGLEGKVELTAYGTQQDTSYLRECEEIAAAIPGLTVQFPGVISPDDIPGALAHHHFFYAATWGENYGHAIAEALVHGVPVIISDRTPWRGLQEREAGWDLPLEPGPFGAALRQALEMDESTYLRWCRGALEAGRSIAAAPGAVAASEALFA